MRELDEEKYYIHLVTHYVQTGYDWYYDRQHKMITDDDINILLEVFWSSVEQKWAHEVAE